MRLSGRSGGQRCRRDQVNASLWDAGVLVAHAPLHSVESATTVRVRGDETELTDGPFAVTKEVLAATTCLIARILTRRSACLALPWARHGSVEVRPIVADEEIPRPDRSAGAS